MKNKQWMTALLGVLLLLLLGLGIVFFAQQPTLLTAFDTTPNTVSMPDQPVQSAESVAITPTEVSATQVNTATSWKTFTDSEAGYSIQYPENFVIASGKSKGEIYKKTEILFRLPDVKGSQAMSIRIEANPQNLPVEEVINRIYQRINGESVQAQALLDLEQVSVAGTTGYKTTILPGQTDFQILVPHGDKVYHFALVHGLALIESAPEAKAIFAHILETFQIQP